MRRLIESMMVLLGTLLAAALVALGAPASADLALVEAVKPAPQPAMAGDTPAEMLRRVWQSLGSAAPR